MNILSVLLPLLTVLSVATAFSCVGLDTGYYCKGTGFALCYADAEYDYACAAGTSCNCGEGVQCDTPCTMACEVGDRTTPAYNYCQERIGNFLGQQGYFCDALAGGFYQCVRDAYCPTNASPQSAYQQCPLGTECACGDTYFECSLSTQRTPCLYNSSYVPLTTQPLTTQPLTTQPLTTQPLTTQPLTTQPLTTQPLTTQPLTTQPLTTQPLTTQPLTTQPLTTQPLTTQPLTTQPLTTRALTTQPLTTRALTTQPLTTNSQPITSGAAQTPHQQALCGNNRWDCIYFSQGDSAHSCHDDTCGDVGDGGYCFWDISDNAGVCAGNFYCSNAKQCNSASDCPGGYSCIINSCCGAQGYCGPTCDGGYS